MVADVDKGLTSHGRLLSNNLGAKLEMNLSLTGFQRAYVLATPILGTLAISAGIWQETSMPKPSILVIAVSAIGIAWFWHFFTSISLEAVLDGRNLVNRTLRGNSRISCDDIQSIDAREWNRGIITIRHQRGTVYMLRSMRGALPLVAELQRLNPANAVRTGFW